MAKESKDDKLAEKRSARPLGVASERIVWGEWVVLAFVVAAAVFLRSRHLGDAPLSHFDEGVYAAGIFCSHLDPPDEYPLRHLYAPPVWPAILGETITWLGPEAVLLPGVAFGVATVVLLWWVSRAWFGATAGLVSAGLLSLSDVHVLFSRSALTDVPMAFLMLAAVYAGWVACLSRSRAALIISGLLAGLCWSTKYNGWLALAVLLSAALAWRYVERKDTDVRDAKPLLRCGIIAMIAIGAWLPVLWALQDVGGYASVAENHRQYFGGVGLWWTAVWHQIAAMQVAAQSGTIWPLVGLIGTGLLAIRPLKAGISYFIASLLGTRLRLLTYVVPSVGTSIKSLTNLARGVEQSQSRKYGTWLTLAWLFGLTLAIPLYTPYLRLVVPLLVAGCVAWGDLVSRHAVTDWTNRRHVGAAVGLLCIVFLVYAMSLPDGRRTLAQDTIDDVAGRIVERLPGTLSDGTSAIGLYVFGEPALYFHLAKREANANVAYVTQPAANDGVLDRARTDATLTPLVVVGPHSDKTRHEYAADPRLVHIADYPYRPGLIAALDRASRESLDERPFRIPTATYSLFRVRSIGERR